MTTNTKLTSRQRKVITALLSCGSVPKAAKASGVSERSIYRYLADDDFQQALLAAESDAINQATRRLLGLQDKAVGILEGIMDDDEASDSVRLRAATNVLDYLLKLRELRNVEDRLAALEEAVNEQD